MTDTEQKSCATCGFLAVKDANSHGLESASASFRENGTVEKRADNQPLHQTVPLCFVRARDLKEYIGSKQAEQIRSRLNAAIECDEHVPWLQGYSPKEHREMLINDKLLSYERDRDLSARRWQEEQAAKQEERDRRRDTMHMIQLAIMVVSMLVSAIIAYFGRK